MSSSSRRMLVPVVTTFLRSGTAFAQDAITGAAAGNFIDVTGAVLPGVTVTLAGPRLQGMRTTTTDAGGFYRFHDVPPGADYTVTATLSGFKDATRSGVRVFLGQEGTVNMTLSPAGVVESVTVVATVPLVDVGQTSTGVNITSSLFERLPSARGFQQLTALAPGVSLEMSDHDRRFDDSPSVGASSAPENNYRSG